MESNLLFVKKRRLEALEARERAKIAQQLAAELGEEQPTFLSEDFRFLLSRSLKLQWDSGTAGLKRKGRKNDYGIKS